MTGGHAAIIARAALIAIPLLASACAPGRGLEAVRLIAAVGTEKAVPSGRERVRFAVAGRRYAGDLYRPEGEPRAALVLVPGVAPAGSDDPRLIAFAAALEQARFLVLVPEIANLRALKVRAEDARPIADAARWLAAGAGARPLGVAAVSYALGPAILAATAPDSCVRIDFVLGIGGYHDIVAAITFATTGAYREAPGEAWRFARPNRYGAWVFVLSNLDRIENAGDRAALEAIARRRLADPNAPIGALAAGLGAEGRAVLGLVTNRDPDRVAGLIADLPPAVRRDIAALDLAHRDLSPLRARLLLVHGADDDIVPVSESRALARRVPGSALYVVPGFGHVGSAPGLAGTSVLWRAAYRLLGFRDGIGLPPRGQTCGQRSLVIGLPGARSGSGGISWMSGRGWKTASSPAQRLTWARRRRSGERLPGAPWTRSPWWTVQSPGSRAKLAISRPSRRASMSGTSGKGSLYWAMPEKVAAR